MAQTGTEGLFEATLAETSAPLARRMRPASFDEFVGQAHVLGPEKPLRRLIGEGRMFSYIVFGPPGCGKSAFAALVAGHARAVFEALNAVTSNVAELKEAIGRAAGRRSFEGRNTVLFIDEIHRFNKLQQDALLPAVEDGTVFLIGVTTQNPAFVLNGALVSRCQLVEFRPLGPDDLAPLVDRALGDGERGLGARGLSITEEARAALVAGSSGDARRLYNRLELAAASVADGAAITLEILHETGGGQGVPLYDRDGDNHYDIVSAFIKSMRGSDPDATLYWLARMIAGGEHPEFIARRIMIAASEDVGLADSGVLSVTVAAAQAVAMLGMPEARIVLAHAALRVALAPKSNSAIAGIEAALAEIAANGPEAVPDRLRDAHYATASRLGHGEGYLYPHDYPDHHVAQAYTATPKKFYVPGSLGSEAGFGKWLDFLRSKK